MCANNLAHSTQFYPVLLIQIKETSRKTSVKSFLFIWLSSQITVNLHKIGCASPKQVNFLWFRLALSLHKIGCASPK
ncbi:hypothetical protein DEM91_01575 [Prevotella sp. TCVGH]|nr:hypothetical protein [Prevotella sp. TCVGH]